MAVVYFITENYVKEMTAITQNVDANEFNFLVKTNADMWVKGYIGSYFYDYLLAKYNAQTLNVDETYLVQEMIRPLIAWRVASDAFFATANQMKNKGPQTQSGDNSQPVGQQVTVFGMKHYQQKAEWYQNFLGAYLGDCDNHNLFPEFISELNKHAILKPKVKNYNAFGNDMLFI